MSRDPAILAVHDDTLVGSPYRARFFNGATIFPRLLFMAQAQDAGPLGLASGQRAVRSARTTSEKEPWKSIPTLEGVVETEFVHPVLLGESVLPYRVLAARDAVLPLEGTTLLDGDHPRLDLYPGLADWWRTAERTWTAHRSSDRLTLLEQLNFRRKLTTQLPLPPLRVVYGKAGMHVAAALVEDTRAVIDHTLYWAAVTTRPEGLYLCAILNSPILTDLARPLMSYGKDERHIDKALWQLPIPLYDAANDDHRQLADLGQACMDYVAVMALNSAANFVTQRRAARAALANFPAAQQANLLVDQLVAP